MSPRFLRRSLMGVLLYAGVATVYLLLPPFLATLAAAIVAENSNGSVTTSLAMTCTGTDRYLIVGIELDTGADQELTVNFNTTETMTELVERNGQWGALYGLDEPSATTANVTFTGSASASIMMGICFSGVSGVEMSDGEESASTTSFEGLVLTGIDAGDLVVEMVTGNTKAAGWLTFTGNTELFDLGDGDHGAGMATGTSSDPAVSWTGATRGNHLATVLNAAGGGGGTPGCRMLTLLGVGGTCSED